MNGTVTIAERAPTVPEYTALIAAVGWRKRDERAIELAMRQSLYAVCAQCDGAVIGCGRVIGDGGLHFYLTDVIVLPEYQRRGIGTRIVETLTRHVEAIPYINALVAVLPEPGLVSFYARHGYEARSADSPVMQRWINPELASVRSEV